MNKCINVGHPEFKKLVEQSKMNPLVLKSKVGVWQEMNNTDDFPSIEELLKEKEIIKDGIPIDEAAQEISRLIGNAMASNGFKTNPNLMSNNKDRRLYGMLRGHMIVLAEIDGKVHPTAARHESMHYILDYCLSPEDFKKVTDAAIRKMNLQNRATYKPENSTITDAMEYLCDGFETFKIKPKTRLKTIFDKIYNAIYRLLKGYQNAQEIIDSLYYDVESGKYADGNSAIFDNNIEGVERYKSIDNEYTKNEAISSLYDMYGEKSDIIKLTKDKYNQVLIERASSVGKYIESDKTITNRLAELYFNLTDKNNYDFINNTIIPNFKISIGEYIERYGIDYALDDMKTVQLNENVSTAMIAKAYGIFNIPELDINEAIEYLVLSYPMMKAYFNGNDTPIKTYVQIIDNSIDVNRLSADVDNYRKSENNVNAVSYQPSYNKSNNINDLVSLRYRDIINNITYTSGKYEKNITWEEYSTLMFEIAREFHFNINNFAHSDKMELSYKEIMDAITQKAKISKEGKATLESIVNYLGYIDYNNTDKEYVRHLIEEEYDPDTTEMNFLDYGYGHILDRLIDYTTIGSTTNEIFKEIAGDNYKEVYDRLKNRLDNIQTNIINYTVNYFNSMAKRDIHVAQVSGKIIAKITDNKIMTSKNMDKVIENTLFVLDDEGQRSGITDLSRKLANDYAYTNKYIFTHIPSDTEIKLDGPLTDKEISYIYNFLDKFYEGYIYDKNSIYEERTDGKHLSSLAISNIATIIRTVKTNIHKKDKDEYENYVNSDFITKLNTNNYIMTSTEMMKNASGEYVSPMAVRTNLNTYFGYGTRKLQQVYKDSPMFKDGEEYLNPFLSGDIRIIDMPELNGMENKVTGKTWDELTLKDRLDCFFNKEMIKDGKYYNVLVSHTGDRKTTYIATLEENKFYKINNKTITINKDYVGGIIKQYMKFHEKIYKQSQQRLKEYDVTIKGDLLIYQGEPVELYSMVDIEGVHTYVRTDKANYILANLRQNTDYIIKENKFYKGNAGNNKIFGVTKKKLNSNIDYYDYFNTQITEQKQLFYKMLSDNNYKPTEKIELYAKEDSNDLLDAYYITHVLVNEGISNIMTGTTDYAKNDEDYVKRSMGYTAPTNYIKGDPNSTVPNIGNKTRFALMQDIPGGNSLFGGMKDNLSTDGVVLYPMFYRTALKNSAGGELSFIGNGANKTVNHHYDTNTGQLHYMKCSEMCVNYNMFRKNLGQEIYKVSLDHDIIVKKGDVFVSENPYDIFKNLIRDIETSKDKNKAFEEANNKLLDYLWNTRVYDGNNDIGRAYDFIAHKVIFQSALKIGQEKVNSWSINENGKYNFPSNKNLLVQEVSNDNYGIQQNKLQSTQVQRKPVMTQLLKLIGVFSNNSDTYNSILESLNNIAEIKLKQLNFKDDDSTITYYKNKIKAKLINNYDTRKKLVVDESKSLEQVKQDIINEIFNDIDDVIKPVVGGNMYVQEPAFTYFKGDKEIPLKPFRYIGESGVYTDKNTLFSDIKERKKISIGLQECIMAFPHQQEFGIGENISLQQAFSFFGYDLYATSEDYELRDKKLQIKESKLKEIKDNILRGIKSGYEIKIGDVYYDVKENKHLVSKKENINQNNIADINLLLKNSNIPNTIKNIFSKQLGLSEANETIQERLDKIANIIIKYYTNLNDACNCYTLRIPTTNTSSGFPTRIVEFDSTIDNTILISPEKSLLDGSDFDIDELNVFFPSLRHNIASNDLMGEDKFKTDFFNAILSYYGDVDNSKSVLSSITTKNLKHITDDMEVSKHYINTPNHMFINQNMNLSGSSLIGYLVKTQTTFSHLMSTVNSMDNDYINKYPIFTNDILKEQFNDVCTELINGATDNANLGGAIGKLKISENNNNMVSGILMNMHVPVLFNSLLEFKKQTDDSYEDNKMLEEYGLVKNDIGYIRDDTKDKNLSVRYILDILKMLSYNEKLKNIYKDIEESKSLTAFSKRTSLVNKLDSLDNKDELLNALYEYSVQGEALFIYNLMLIESMSHKINDITNSIMNIGKALGITEEREIVEIDEINGKTATITNHKIDRTLSQKILQYIDNINKTDEYGIPINENININAVSKRYNIPKKRLQEIYDTIPFRDLLANDKYMQNKIRMICLSEEIKNEIFVTEKLASTILNHAIINNKLSYIDSDKTIALQKEIDRLYIGNLISNMEDTIISYDGINYDLKNEGRIKFYTVFPEILREMRTIFNKDNMFLNYMKAIPMQNDVFYGINKLKYLNESEKENLRRSYDKVYNAAKFNMPNDIYNSLPETEKYRIDRIRNGIKAIEYMNLLQQGYYGNSVDISSVIKPYIGKKIIEVEPKVENDIKKLIEEIRNDRTHKVYRYITMRMGLATGAVSSSYDNYIPSYDVRMKDPEKTYTMTTYSGANDENIIYSDGKSYINPWGNHYNMYGVNGITPLLNGDNKTLRYIGKQMLKDALDGKDIVLNENDVKRFYLDNELSVGNKKVNPQTGELVLIGNRAYKITKEGNYILKPVETQNGTKNDDSSILRTMNTSRNNIKNIASKEQIEAFVNHIQRVFPNIKVEYTFDNREIAYIQNGKVYINMDRVSSDSFIHELAHIFSIVIRETDPERYAQLSNEVQRHINNNSPVVRYIKAKYPEMSNDDMILEVIANIIQVQQAENMEAFLLQQNATTEEIPVMMQLWKNIKEFFKKALEVIGKLFGGNWSDTMTIKDMGDILMKAVKEGQALSYMTSQQIASLQTTKLNTVSNTIPVNTSADFISNLTEYTVRYGGKTDDEITEILYQHAIQNGNKLSYGSKEYDYSKYSADDTKKLIKKNITPNFSQNMPSQKANIIAAINEVKNTDKSLITELSFKLGMNENDKPKYSLDSCIKLNRILQPDNTKSYHMLDDIINNKDIAKTHREAFEALKDITGYNPVVSIEYEDDKDMTVSIYDITNKDLNWVDNQVGKKNILAKYGIIARQASVLGITLTNSEFDVRALMLTVITNILQKNGVKVRDVSVTKLNYGNDSDAVVSKRVPMHEINHNITIMNSIKEFMSTINNEAIKDVFNTPKDKLTTNDINYWELLSSLYREYYNTPNKRYGEGQYDPIIRDNYDSISTGKISLEQKMNIINWRLKQLSDKPINSMTDFEINESRILLDALKNLQSSSKMIHQFTKKSVLNSLNKLWNTFDIDSEEVQFVRSIITQNSNKIVYDVRKKKEEMYDIWKHYVDEHGKGQQYITNPYFLFKDLYATIKTKDGKDAFIGRILWTTDETKDNEFAQQAKSKIDQGKLSKKDLEMAGKICDAIEETYIEMMKHEQWMKFGTEDVFVSKGVRDAYGKLQQKKKTLTKEEWLERLYNRGYKRGMIPIMQKNYIDGAKAFGKRIGLSFSYSSDEYKDAEAETFDPANSDKTIDDITHIFMNQLSPVEVDLNIATDPTNIGQKIDNKYGYIQRNSHLGLVRDDTGEYIFSELKGEEKNMSINKDLEFVYNFFNLVMTRKRVHEKNTIPVINETVKLLEMGRAFSIDKNTDAIVDVIRNLAEMAVKGSSYKIKNFGPKYGGKSVGEYLTTLGKGYVGMQMFMNINVAMNSAIINTLKATVERISGDTFVGKHLYSSYGYVMKNMKDCYKIASDLNIIRQTEYDTYSPGYKGAVTNKSFFTNFTSNILNWGTDSYSRTSAMIAKMKQDGILQAYTNDVYDDTKDRRFFNEDGTQTTEQKIFYESIKEIHRTQGIDMRIDEKGQEHLTRPYTLDESNAIKEWADKRIIGGYDNMVKSILSNSVLGRMALMYFNWFPAALKGLVGKGLNHETIFSYKYDADTGKLYKDLYFSEGILVTVYNIGKRAWQARDIRFWNHIQNQTQKQNLVRLMATIGLGVLLKVIYNFLVLDDDDEDDKYGILPNYRILKNIDFASEGLIMFMYKDALQRLHKPFVMTDNISNIFDIQQKRININRLMNTVPMGSSLNVGTEIVTGSNINELIKE